MSENKKKGIGHEIVALLKANIRDYMMYIALILIMGFFTLRTHGGFIQARNIANLINQAGYVAGFSGNEQAAELSGVNVKKVTMLAFCSMSTLAALAGILYTSRLQSATPTAGNAFEMDAIASSYIGGVAVSGGIGRVTNTIIGALVIMSLTNGMNLMGVDISYQYIVKGIIFIIAVAFDVQTRKKAR